MATRGLYIPDAQWDQIRELGPGLETDGFDVKDTKHGGYSRSKIVCALIKLHAPAKAKTTPIKTAILD